MEIGKFLGKSRVEPQREVRSAYVESVVAFDLRADDTRFSTEIGLPSGQGGVHSFKPTGYLIYGPYIDLEPGRYIVTFAGEMYMSSNGKFTIDITANSGETLLASKVIRGDNDVFEFGAVQFDLESKASYMEIRVHVDSAKFSEFRGLQISQVSPDLDSVSSPIFDNGNTVGTLRQAGFDRLAIVFHPFNSSGATNDLNDWAFWRSRGYDLLSFRQRRDTWYQDIASFRGGQVPKYLAQYRERVAFGSSMGGYAALYFASMLNIQKVIAFSPQYSVDNRVENFESRWGSLIARTGFSHSWDDKTFPTNAYLVFDPKNLLDRLHAEALMARFETSKAVKIPYAGHLYLSTIADWSGAEAILDSLLEGRELDTCALTSRVRERSQSYITSLIESALQRNRIERAMNLWISLTEMVQPPIAWTIARADTIAGKVEQLDGPVSERQVYDFARKIVMSKGGGYPSRPPIESWK